MGMLKQNHPQSGGPPNPSQFGSDSVLGRMARGGYKPTDTDLEEVRQLAQTGNRAERRAAAKHLKKHGIAAPVAAPRAPVVMPAVEEVEAPRQTAAPPPVQEKPAAKKVKAAAKKAAVKKTPAKKAVAKTAVAKKAPAKKAAAQKAPVKKTTAKKAAAKTPRKK